LSSLNSNGKKGLRLTVMKKFILPKEDEKTNSLQYIKIVY